MMNKSELKADIVVSVSERHIREALTQEYPDGHRNAESSELLLTVFEAIQCRYSADNLSG